jgi:hypothetical protein
VVVADSVSLETLAAMIDDTRLEREGVETKLGAAMEAVEKLRTLQGQLRAEQDALEGRMSRLFPDEKTVREIAEPPFPAYPNWQTMPRTVAVETAIAELSDAADSAGPSDIENFLRNRGRADTRDEIGGAVAHLNRTHKIHSVGRAKWVPGPEPVEPEV